MIKIITTKYYNQLIQANNTLLGESVILNRKLLELQSKIEQLNKIIYK